MNFPTRGIGARSLEVLADAARTYSTSLYATVPHLSGKPGSALAVFVRLVEELRRDTAGLPLPELVDHVLDLSGLRAHYKADKEGRERLENLDELINAAANFLAEAQAQAAPARRSRTRCWRISSPTPRWRRATTRTTRARTRCS